MRKLYMLFLVTMIAFGMVACKSETVTLHCDGENCPNTVEVKVEKGSTPDESWVVFCQNCADKVLDD